MYLWNVGVKCGVSITVFLFSNIFGSSIQKQYCTTGYKKKTIFDIPHKTMMPRVITWYYFYFQLSYIHSSHHKTWLCFVRQILIFGHIFWNQVISFLYTPWGRNYHTHATMYTINNLHIEFNWFYWSFYFFWFYFYLFISLLWTFV